MNFKTSTLLIFLLLIGTLLRFYNLLWGSPYFFHPDERNIVYAISRLSFPTQLNPHFFAYGSLPMYIVYGISTFFSSLLSMEKDLGFLVFWLRVCSAILSVLIIPSIFFIGTHLYNKRIGIIAAFFATFSVGFIQFAHFGTFEVWTSFFALWLFYYSILLSKELTAKNILLTGLSAGIMTAIKISNIVVVAFPLLCIGIYIFKTKKIQILKLVTFLVIYLGTVGLIYFVTNPFVFLDFKDFYNSIHYESSVGLGTFLVFYTGGFFNTTPIIFQFLKIYPFLLNPLLTFLFIPTFVFTFLKGIKERNSSLILMIVYFLLLFLSQAILFVKWTRYMVPTIAFIYIIIAVFLESLPRKIKHSSLVLICLIAILYSFAFLQTVYIPPDTRLVAAQWAARHFSRSQQVVTEPYDLGILPFNGNFPFIRQAPLYDIDHNQQSLAIATNDFDNASIFISPSQRLIHSRIFNKEAFPEGNVFYTNLLSNKTTYKKVYETPCDIYCRITYMGDPIFNVEETAAVFDRPTVTIFKKTR